MDDEPLRQLSLLVRSASELQQRARQLREALDPGVGQDNGAASAGSADLTEWLRLAAQLATATTRLAHDMHALRLGQATALRAEGVTMTQLASTFGISRQRVAVLLKQAQTTNSTTTTTTTTS